MPDPTRLEAIIAEVKTRAATQGPGDQPRADVLLVAEIERLRGAMEAAASMPGAEWLTCQLALGEALDDSHGTAHLDYVLQQHAAYLETQGDRP